MAVWLQVMAGQAYKGIMDYGCMVASNGWPSTKLQKLLIWVLAQHSYGTNLHKPLLHSLARKGPSQSVRPK